MNAITGLKPNSKPPKTSKQKKSPTGKIYFLYLLCGILLSFSLLTLQPTIKTPLWFGVFFILLSLVTAYLIFFKTFSFSVGKVHMLVNEENSNEYKTVSRRVKDSKPLNQLPSELKMAHYLGIFFNWGLFFIITFYLISLSM